MTRRVLRLRRHTVIVSLYNPKEKIWGVLLAIVPEGIWVHGIELASFDDWSRELARQEGERHTVIGMSTMFFPMHRVERIVIDEAAGTAMSLAEQFRMRVGKDIFDWIDWDTVESIFQWEPA